ncbi:MAG: histidine kinase [bacterium]|nr:histidine kinase [bacterium]
MNKRWKNLSIQNKLMFAFVITIICFVGLNFFTYYSINLVVNHMNNVYSSNMELNDLLENLDQVQTYMTEYLKTKTTDSLEDYFRSEQEYRRKLEALNDKPTDNRRKLAEKNIKNMSVQYLETVERAIEAKRKRNVEQYRLYYDNCTELYDGITASITALNNQQFIENSARYKEYYQFVSVMEHGCNILLLIIAAFNLILIVLLTRNIVSPLRSLAQKADVVATGDFDTELLPVESGDEIGIVSSAFNKMIVSIREYIERLKHSMEIERQMKEKELLMEAHLKDAKLKYLQAQINPHFLFNTLNAGAQLAMMEDAQRSYDYIQNMAQFFRYNIKKDNDVVYVKDEIELIDHYMYILNVRFSGELLFEKEIDERLLNLRIPSMILQPIVENAVNYGVRNVPWEKSIKLTLQEEGDVASLSITDNGIGMSGELIHKIMTSQLAPSDLSGDSNGIGLDNVIARLSIFYNREDVFCIHSDGEDMGTTVTIRIPLNVREMPEVANV